MRGMSKAGEYPAPLTPPQLGRSASICVYPPAAIRNPEDVCFGCKRRGHWSYECPNKISKRSPSSSPSATASLPVIRCPCGLGTCPIYTSSSESNPGRTFYSCPSSPSSSGWGNSFFMWCDEVVDLRAPMCPCGAGISCLNKQSPASTYPTPWYFSCRIRKNHGACSFFQWADPQVNLIMNRHKCQSKGVSSSEPSLTSHQLLTSINDDLGKKQGLALEMDFESSAVDSSEMGFKPPIVESSVNMHSNRNQLLPVLGREDVETSRPTTGKELQVSQMMSQSEIRPCQAGFRRLISAAGDILTEGVIYQILGFHVYGWLGRLVFPPSHCPNYRPHASIFCSVFPSFNPVNVRDDIDMSGNEGSILLPFSLSNIEADVLPAQTRTHDAQLSSGVWEHSRSDLENPSSSIQGDVVSKSILKKFGEGLVDILEIMTPFDHQRMLKVTEAICGALHGLQIYHQPFSESVNRYIDFASKIVKIQDSMLIKDVCAQELMSKCNNEKSRFEEISCRHAKMMADYKASDNHVQDLRQEVSRAKDTLLQLEQELSKYEDQTLELQTQLLMMSENMSEMGRRMEAACMQREEVLALERVREDLQEAAKTALERARSQLSSQC